MTKLVTQKSYSKDELTPSVTCSSHYFPALKPPVLSATCGTLTCLQPGTVPRQTAGVSEACTQRHTDTHTQETQRWKRREGGCEGNIHRPWNRAGLAQVRASLPGHLSGKWVFQGSDVKVSTMWMTWLMTRLLNYVCTALAFQQYLLLALLGKHPVFDPIKQQSLCWV